MMINTRYLLLWGAIFTLLASPTIMAMSPTSANSLPLANIKGQQAYTFTSAEKKLFPSDWEVSYAHNNYRKLVIRFQTTGKYQPRWSDILDDVSKRYGLASLISTYDKKIIVVPADEFKERGIHYVKTRRVQDVERYQWNHWVAMSAKADGEYLLAQEQEKQQQKAWQDQRNTAKVELVANRLESDYKLKEKNLIASYKIQEDNLERVEKYLRESIVETEYRSQLHRESTLDAIEARNNYDSATAVKVLEAKRTEEINKAYEKELSAKLKKHEKEMLKAKKKFAEEMAAAERLHNERNKALDEERVEFIANKRQFFPESSRVMEIGKGSSVVKEFFEDNWKYSVVWDQDLLDPVQREKLKFDYKMHFSGESLTGDVSQIACALTRDVGGIVVAADLLEEQRVVYLQFHRSTKSIRDKLLAECYKG